METAWRGRPAPSSKPVKRGGCTPDRSEHAASAPAGSHCRGIAVDAQGLLPVSSPPSGCAPRSDAGRLAATGDLVALRRATCGVRCKIVGVGGPAWLVPAGTSQGDRVAVRAGTTQSSQGLERPLACVNGAACPPPPRAGPPRVASRRAVPGKVRSRAWHSRPAAAPWPIAQEVSSLHEPGGLPDRESCARDHQEQDHDVAAGQAAGPGSATAGTSGSAAFRVPGAFRG